MTFETRDGKQQGGQPWPVLATGAAGYLGGRFLRVLEQHGLQLRCATDRALRRARLCETRIPAGGTAEIKRLSASPG